MPTVNATGGGAAQADKPAPNIAKMTNGMTLKTTLTIDLPTVITNIIDHLYDIVSKTTLTQQNQDLLHVFSDNSSTKASENQVMALIKDDASIDR